MFLGTFFNSENRTRLDLWVNPAELNFWSELKGFALTYGIMIIGVLGGVVLALLIFALTESVKVALLTFVLILTFLATIGVIPLSVLPFI